MHSFDDLAIRSTTFYLNVLIEKQEELRKILKDSAPNSVIKNLQMIQLTKAALAVGLFSMFEAEIQRSLNCDEKYAFNKASTLLKKKGKLELNTRFKDFRDAINVLKHGEGTSYYRLVSKYKSNLLPFRVKLPQESFFEEGDISEVSTLIEVDINFITDCAELISSISLTIKEHLDSIKKL